jgi:acyl carrier protein
MMTEQERLTTSTRIQSGLLGDESIELTMDTVREDVAGWDSFNYINFIVATEAGFGVKFRIAEVESFPDVGAIVKAIGSAHGR